MIHQSHHTCRIQGQTKTTRDKEILQVCTEIDRDTELSNMKKLGIT
jgi:hypothetical protein